MTGQTICRMHGGMAPQNIRKASQRIADVRDLALEKLRLDIEAGSVRPETLLAVVDKFTQQVELLEGRATERTEEMNVNTAMAVIDAEIARLEGQMDD